MKKELVFLLTSGEKIFYPIEEGKEQEELDEALYELINKKWISTPNCYMKTDHIAAIYIISEDDL